MSQQQRTILIVDDSPEDRELYRRYLLRDREYSYTIVEAGLGQLGLELWQQHHPDVVLLDYRLPDLDGLEFLLQLQPLSQESCVPVIVVTGQGNEAIAVQVMKAGAQDYLIKGEITPERLQTVVHTVIETVQLRSQLQQQFEQQRLVMKMTQRIRRTLNLQDILQTTVDEVRQFLGCDRVIIFQFSPTWGGTVVVESVALEWMAILPLQIHDPCIGEENVQPFKEGLVSAKADIYTAEISPCHIEFLESLQVRANLVVPILLGDELWGLLAVHHCAAPREWQSREIDLLRQLGEQVSIAIQQAALFEQVQTELRERKEAEMALQESEEKLRLFIQYAPASIVMFDRQMRYISASKQWIEQFRVNSIESIFGRSHYELFPNLPEHLKQSYQRALAGFIEKCDEDLFVHSDGLEQWFRWEVHPWYRSNGNIGGIILFSEEITERKLAEIALRESQIQLQRQLVEIETIYQSAPIGLTLLDTNLRFVRINERLAEMNGFSVQAHIGCTVRELLPDLADAAEQLLCSILETGEPVLNVEITGETPAQPGVQRTWLESFLPLKDGDCIIGISTVCEEITERKQAQIALQQLNAKLEQQVVQRTAQLRSANDRLLETVRQQQQTQIILLEQAQLLDLAHDTIITRDLNGAIGFWNQGAESMYGWTKAEALGQISHILLKTQFPQSLSEIETELLEKGYWEGELIHFTWDERPVNVASRWVLQKDNAGQPIKILEINNDITEQKLAEAALQEYVHEVEDLYNNAPCGYHSLDAEGNFIRINNTELNWLGYTRDEIFHKKFSDIVTSVSKQVFQENFPRFKQQGWLNNLEFEIVSKDGTTRWISLNATAIKDKAGNFVMSRSTLFDISERKRMEQVLRSSEQRYRSVITVMAEGIVLQKSDGRITACNDSAERILGLTADQMMGRTSIDPRWQAIHEDGTSFPGETHPAIVTLRTGQPQFDVIMGVYKPDGSLTWISINSLPLFESDESKPYAVVASFTDITVRKQAQIALQQQTERERMVYAIAQHIRESLDLDEILNTTVAEIRHFLQTDRVIIYRINADWSGTVVTESVAFGWKPILNMEIADTYFGETQGRQAYQQGKIKVTPDIYTAGLTACHLELLEQLQVRAKIIVPILQGDRLWGLLIAHHCSAPRQWQSWESELLQQLATQVAIAIGQSELYQQLQRANQQLENMVMVDQLTQIPNRRCFDSRLDSVWQYFLREQGFISLLLCDIDYFKQYNDTYGHAAGDTCLTLIAQALKQAVKRSRDLAARYGGEEFVVILPNTASDGAFQVAQEIHQAIQRLNILHAASAVKQHVTLSIGIATVIPTPNMLPLDLIKAADQALYQAKAQGRNRSCMWNPIDPYVPSRRYPG